MLQSFGMERPAVVMFAQFIMMDLVYRMTGLIISNRCYDSLGFLLGRCR